MGDLPETEALANPKTDFATRVYSFDGKVLGRYYTENRSDARFETLPPHLVEALTSTEDARFYDHAGIDFIGLARAIAYMGKRGGGSTVTQQLAKLLFTDKYETTSFFERAVLQNPRSGSSRPAWNATTPRRKLWHCTSTATTSSTKRWASKVPPTSTSTSLRRNSTCKSRPCWWAC